MRGDEIQHFLTGYAAVLRDAVGAEGIFSKNRSVGRALPHFVHIGIPMGLMYWSGWFVRLAVVAGVAQRCSDLAVERA